MIVALDCCTNVLLSLCVIYYHIQAIKTTLFETYLMYLDFITSFCLSTVSLLNI
jgi:hypothetical protein